MYQFLYSHFRFCTDFAGFASCADLTLLACTGETEQVTGLCWRDASILSLIFLLVSHLMPSDSISLVNVSNSYH